MKNYLLLVFLLLSITNKAQENYSTLTQLALETMWNAKDSNDTKKALELYQQAFGLFPDSIDQLGLYKASVLASQLKDYDTAFSYLIPLTQNTDQNNKSLPWSYILGKYSQKEYQNLLLDPRWEQLKDKAELDKTAFYNQLNQNQKEFFQTKQYQFNTKNPEQLYFELKNHNPYIAKNHRDYSITFTINDSTKTSYFIHLPKNYNPRKKYPLLFFLHGAVKSNSLTDYQLSEWNLQHWNRFYTKYADLNQVILVFPRANKQYNWMSPDDGFFMVPQILRQIKQAIHIDDNKVFISGHSNGATGSFSYLMKKPTDFAGFYGFNTYPKVFTGGTFLENIKNRSFINFSTDQDYYYPPNANDSLTKKMADIQANYKEYRYNGFPHWFPEFDESEQAYEIVFNDINTRQRNPFPENISWEFDQEDYGNIDWISHIKIDTINPKAPEDNQLNFKINKWLVYNDKDSLVSQDADINAFAFPRKSGKILAKYHNNEFHITTSGIESFFILISPEMVNLKKQLKIYVNNKLYYHQKVDFNREFMLENYKLNHDSQQVWINQIPINLIQGKPK
ncbi:alpha/beta hydrolase-fold protein [Myroides sp. LJL119]